MEAPRRGNGADFNPSAPYRMYHGDLIPGFPQHPHRGFETITATIDGLIDHTDSCGNAGRYGTGDLQWMTAGNGIVHGEMFPLINVQAPNPTRFFQIWLNLPSEKKMVEPAFIMHWAEDVRHVVSDDKLTKATVWAGNLNGTSGLQSPPNSWASYADSDVAIFLLRIKAGGQFTVPAARLGAAVNRVAYFIEGLPNSLSINDQSVSGHCALTLFADQPATFCNTFHSASPVTPANNDDTDVQILILQGRPIGQPVAQHGPFVMNTQAEIQQAFADYRRTQFGGWPWPQDAMVFPRDKGRFALSKGVEYRPPQGKQ